jgi:hypothetical protein
MLNFVDRIDVLYSRNEIVLKPSLVGFFFSLLIFQLPLIVWGGFFFFFLIALLDAFFYFIISISIKNIFKNLIELSS